MSMIISVSYETERSLKTCLHSWILLLSNGIRQMKKGKFERVYIKTQGVHLVSKAKHYRYCIDKLLNELPETDAKFLSQVYTIVKRHKDRVEGLVNVK